MTIVRIRNKAGEQKRIYLNVLEINEAIVSGYFFIRDPDKSSIFKLLDDEILEITNVADNE